MEPSKKSVILSPDPEPETPTSDMIRAVQALEPLPPASATVKYGDTSSLPIATVRPEVTDIESQSHIVGHTSGENVTQVRI